MSPSWSSIVFIFSKSCLIRDVSRKFMCRSSTKNRKMRPAASLVGRSGGRMIPSCGAGAGGACRLNVRPPCTSCTDAISCGTPSSRTAELFLREIRDELAGAVADDDVGGHQVDERPERGSLRGRVGWRGGWVAGGLAGRSLGRQRRGGQDERRQHGATEQHSHLKSIARPDARDWAGANWRFGRTRAETWPVLLVFRPVRSSSDSSEVGRHRPTPRHRRVAHRPGSPRARPAPRPGDAAAGDGAARRSDGVPARCRPPRPGPR